jgi:hypothetical protein
LSAQLRPDAVTIIALINLNLGVCGLLGVCCLGLDLLTPASVLRFLTEGRSWRLLAIVWGVIICWAILTTVLIVTGVGLMKMRPWARTACLAFAAIMILTTVSTLVILVALFTDDAASADPSNLVGPLIVVSYPVVLLVVLNLPAVKRAFAAVPTGVTTGEVSSRPEQRL